MYRGDAHPLLVLAIFAVIAVTYWIEPDAVPRVAIWSLVVAVGGTLLWRHVLKDL